MKPVELLAALRDRVRRWKTTITAWCRRWLLALEPPTVSARWIGRFGFAAVLVSGAWVGATMVHLRFGVVVDALFGVLIIEGIMLAPALHSRAGSGTFALVND
ncbi:MAG TPA: hypothetical protein PKZ76_04185 [Xanthomonadaceae bacterium]|nr:hypothetical protein [Xanthomonadaceae bacterium]